MDRRQFLAASTVGVAATVAGCMANVTGGSEGSGQGAPPEDDSSHNAIEVSANGSAEAEADRATSSIGVEASGETADEVNEELREGADVLRETFDELGIPDENIETGQFRINERRQETGFEGSHAFQVEVDDVDRVGEIIDAAVDAGADDVGRVNFTLTEETRAVLRDEALDDALANADSEAEHIAANRDVEITGTRSVSTSDVRVNDVQYRAETDAVADDDAGAPPTEIDSGPVSVTASVTVAYSFE